MAKEANNIIGRWLRGIVRVFTVTQERNPAFGATLAPQKMDVERTAQSRQNAGNVCLPPTPTPAVSWEEKEDGRHSGAKPWVGSELGAVAEVVEDTSHIRAHRGDACAPGRTSADVADAGECLQPRDVEPPMRHAEAESGSEADDSVGLRGLIEVLAKSVQELTAEQRTLVASMAGIADKVNSIKTNYESALLEAHQTIRETAQQVRALEDREWRENILKPLALEFVAVVDDLHALRNILSSDSPESAKRAAEFTDAIDRGMLSALERYGVTRMPRDVSALDTRRQRIVAVETVCARKEGEILSIDVKRDGYECDGQVLRHQEVAVRKVG